jgi:hypothetical protein
MSPVLRSQLIAWPWRSKERNEVHDTFSILGNRIAGPPTAMQESPNFLLKVAAHFSMLKHR